MQGHSRVKITDIKLVRTRLVKVVGELEPAWNPGGKSQFMIGGRDFVEVHTDAGLVGIGPGVDAPLVAEAKARLIGEDPFEIEKHAGTLRYYVRAVPYRGVAGIDIALWDLIGKICGQPLYKLWGGGKDRVTPYASMYLLSTPEERAEMAQSLADEGWKAIKLRLHHESFKEDIRTVETVRAAVGDRMTIMVDGNQAQSSSGWQPGVRWDFRRAIETARELERLGCFWLEEPLPRYAFSQLADLSSKVDIAIAGGENNTGLHEFVDMVQNNVYDMLQPESMVLNGVTTLRKVGLLAEAFGKQIVPHHGGGNIGVIAHLHMVASWTHAPFMELLHDPPIADYRHGFSIMKNPPLVQNGMIEVPQGPGLGVEIDRDLVEE